MTRLARFRGLATALATCLALSGGLTLLTACNTTSGLGKDVSATGNAVTNSADKVKSGL